MTYLYFDIGGTHFRYYVVNKINHDNEIKYESIVIKPHNENNILLNIEKSINYVKKTYKIEYILIALPGIIKNNYVYGVNNVDLKDGTKLIEYHDDIKINYINDGDAYILGEISKLTPFYNIEKKNILGLVFGTGVGGGLIIDGNIIKNSEVHPYFESFMKDNFLTKQNIDMVTTFISNELIKLIKLLTLDYILIGGYVSKFENFENLLKLKINLSEFYETKIFVNHQSDDSILKGLIYISDHEI